MKEGEMGQVTEIKGYSNSEIGERERKYLTFTLAGEDYGIEILQVKEIIGMMPITSVPRTPTFFKGVINLRGKVIPVVDLRLRFGMEEKEYTPQTCIVVVEANKNGVTETIGVVVDSVSEVVNIKTEETEEAPSFSGMVDTEFISAMAKTDAGVKILLDINKVLGVKEGESLRSSEMRILEGDA